MGQIGSTSTPWFEDEGGGPIPGEERLLMSSSPSDGEVLEDVITLAARLYAALRAKPGGTLLEAVAGGLRRGLLAVYPLARVEAEVVSASIRLVWNEGDIETVRLPVGQTSSGSLGVLRFLERLGHTVLRSDAHFPVGTLQLSPPDYWRWARGDEMDTQRWRPLPPNRRAHGPSCVTPVLEWLECPRRAAAAVGWYWCLPMMYLVISGAEPRVVPRLVRCPRAAAWAPVPPRADLCPGLPAGCAVRFRHWPAGTWRRYGPLVQHLGRTVCFSLPGLAWGARERLCPRWREDRYFPLDPDEDDLVVCVVAGRLPLALAGFRRDFVRDDHLYVTSLCALTGGRGGSLLVGWLQRRVPPTGRLCLSADPSVAGFYRRHGFRPEDGSEPGSWWWTPPPLDSTQPVAKRAKR